MRISLNKKYNSESFDFEIKDIEALFIIKKEYINKKIPISDLSDAIWSLDAPKVSENILEHLPVLDIFGNRLEITINKKNLKKIIKKMLKDLPHIFSLIPSEWEVTFS